MASHGLSLCANWHSATVVRISARGELDASNAELLAGYVFRRAANSRGLSWT